MHLLLLAETRLAEHVAQVERLVLVARDVEADALVHGRLARLRRLAEKDVHRCVALSLQARAIVRLAVLPRVYVWSVVRQACVQGLFVLGECKAECACSE